MRLLLALLFVSLAGTQALAGTVICNPRPDQWYTGKGPLKIEQPRLLVVTHASTEFNDSPRTIQTVQSTIELLKPGYEEIFVHVGGFKHYFYPECDPAYFYRATIGDISIDLEAVNEVVLMGGYYSICLGGTTLSVESAIHRLKQPKSLRVTYVLDGVFESVEGLRQNPLLDASVPDEITSVMGGFTFNYAEFLRTFASEDSSEDTVRNMLSSIYQEGGIPNVYAIHAHLRNHYWPKPTGDWMEWTIQQGRAPGAPVLDLYFVESGDLNGAGNALP